MASSSSSSPDNKQGSILVAVDIEKCGSNLIAHKVVSIGFVVAHEDGTLIEKKKINFQIEWFTREYNSNDGTSVLVYGDFEKRCCDEFWSKQPQEIVDACKRNPDPLHPYLGWQEVRLFVDGLEERFPDRKVKFLTDNASFDIAAIDYGLEKYCGRYPMRYSTDNKYRSVIGADDMFDMIPEPHKSAYNAEIKAIVQHDHDPCNDAHHILLQYVYACRYLKLTKH